MFDVYITADPRRNHIKSNNALRYHASVKQSLANPAKLAKKSSQKQKRDAKSSKKVNFNRMVKFGFYRVSKKQNF